MKANKESKKYRFDSNSFNNKDYRDSFIVDLEKMLKNNKIDKNIVGDFEKFKFNYINVNKMIIL